MNINKYLILIIPFLYLSCSQKIEPKRTNVENANSRRTSGCNISIDYTPEYFYQSCLSGISDLIKLDWKYDSINNYHTTYCSFIDVLNHPTFVDCLFKQDSSFVIRNFGKDYIVTQLKDSSTEQFTISYKVKCGGNPNLMHLNFNFKVNPYIITLKTITMN